MGIFDNIFDAFTGKSAREAADKNRQIYAQYRSDATGALDDALSRSTGAAQSGIDAFTPLSDLGKKYGAGSSLYLDALGVNGPEGAARAKQAFTTGPGYEFAVNEATDAAARNAARLGLAGSGNALDAIRARAQGVASQEYGGFLDRLGGLVSPELSATTGAASGQQSGYNALANLYSGYGQNKANVFGSAASGFADANNAEAQAKQNASGTFWNGVFNLGSAAAKGFAPSFGR